MLLLKVSGPGPPCFSHCCFQYVSVEPSGVNRWTQGFPWPSVSRMDARRTEVPSLRSEVSQWLPHNLAHTILFFHVLNLNLFLTFLPLEPGFWDPSLYLDANDDFWLLYNISLGIYTKPAVANWWSADPWWSVRSKRLETAVLNYLDMGI